MTTWMNLEDIMLSEISQSQDKCCIVVLTLSKTVKLIASESRMVVVRGCRKGKRVYCESMGIECQFAR